jgi:hypothetical protein
MARYHKGAYVTVGHGFEPGFQQFRGQIIGGGSHASRIHPFGSQPRVGIDMWTIRVFEYITDEGWVAVDESRTIVATQLQISPWDRVPPEPPKYFCPECGEEDYFLEEDYICAPCRSTLWDS